MIKHFRILYPWDYQDMRLSRDRREAVCEYLTGQYRYTQFIANCRNRNVKPNAAVVKATKLVLKKVFGLTASRRPAVIILLTENSGLLQALAVTVPTSFAFTRAQMQSADGFKVPTCETVTTLQIMLSAMRNRYDDESIESEYAVPQYKRAADADMVFWEDADVPVAGGAKFEGYYTAITKDRAVRGSLILAAQIRSYSTAVRDDTVKSIISALGSGFSKIAGVASTLYIKAPEIKGQEWKEVL